ncbi:MAG: DUF2148 domain-containing protein [Lachnospiraceae bacterium]|nr:DUF2148 domain-containing protein [Lachnospiraceae bacterium]
MIIDSNKAEMAVVLNTAQQMCAAARTAPKTKGQDYIHTCILTDADKEALAAKMEELSTVLGYGFFSRDAANVRVSKAVVLLGVENVRRGLGAGCGYCGHKDCSACEAAGGACAFGPLDLGIAVGSAVSVAEDARIDNRVMFSVGRAALSMGIFDEKVTNVIGIPLSVSGKSPYFDRK